VAIVLPTENPELRIELISEESEKRILSLSGQVLFENLKFFIGFVIELKLKIAKLGVKKIF
jgi:hypothetical protein